MKMVASSLLPGACILFAAVAVAGAHGLSDVELGLGYSVSDMPMSRPRSLMASLKRDKMDRLAKRDDSFARWCGKHVRCAVRCCPYLALVRCA